METIHYIILLAVFFLSPTIIKIFLSVRINHRYKYGDEHNSKNLDAGTLLAKKTFLSGSGVMINVNNDLKNGESWYSPIDNVIHIGKLIDKSKCMAAIAECYHELGHADHRNEMNFKQVYYHCHSLQQRRKFIPILSLIGWSGCAASLLFWESGILAKFMLAIFIATIALVFYFQYQEVILERDASNRAIQHLVDDGFTSSEIQEAQQFLNDALRTYKVELYSNAVKYIGVTLLLFLLTSGNEE